MLRRSLYASHYCSPGPALHAGAQAGQGRSFAFFGGRLKIGKVIGDGDQCYKENKPGYCDRVVEFRLAGQESVPSEKVTLNKKICRSILERTGSAMVPKQEPAGEAGGQ